MAQHHPKEDDYLFKRLRERTDEFDAELDELRRQHLRDEQLVAELAAMVELLAGCVEAPAAAAATRTLDDAVQAYARFLWEHLGREEGVILPAAQRHLQEQDWLEIDSAFRANREGRDDHESDKAWRQLFSRIVNAAPQWPAAAAPPIQEGASPGLRHRKFPCPTPVCHRGSRCAGTPPTGASTPEPLPDLTQHEHHKSRPFLPHRPRRRSRHDACRRTGPGLRVRHRQSRRDGSLGQHTARQPRHAHRKAQ